MNFIILEVMACIKRTFIPENGQQLEESIKECTKEGLMPILQAGVQVKGRSLLDAKELKGKEVAFINVEKLEVTGGWWRMNSKMELSSECLESQRVRYK